MNTSLYIQRSFYGTRFKIQEMNLRNEQVAIELEKLRLQDSASARDPAPGRNWSQDPVQRREEIHGIQDPLDRQPSLPDLCPENR